MIRWRSCMWISLTGRRRRALRPGTRMNARAVRELMPVRLLVLGAAVLMAAPTLAGASVAANGRGVHGFGLSVTLPPGWVGHVLPGEVFAIARSGASIQLDEAVASPQRYVRLPQRVHTGTTRLFVEAGRRKFFLFVHSTTANLAATNAVLASVRIRPWSAPLAPPHFLRAPGWQVGHSGPAPATRANVSGWASTVPYANSPVDLPPDATLARPGTRGVVVWVGLVQPRRSHPFPVRKDPLDLKQAFCTRAWEGEIPGVMQCTLSSHMPNRFEISVYVYVRERSQLAAAQAELRRLVLPKWPIR